MEINIDETRGDNIADVMGISKERMQTLGEVAKVQLLSGGTHTGSFEAICAECNNLEEVVYAIYQYGVAKAKLDAFVGGDNPMMEALRKASGGR